MLHPTRLFLIRHGEVEDQYHRIFGGSRIDMNLSPRGHEQASALARYLQGKAFAAIYVSPMLRAQKMRWYCSSTSPCRMRKSRVGWSMGSVKRKT